MKEFDDIQLAKAKEYMKVLIETYTPEQKTNFVNKYLAYLRADAVCIELERQLNDCAKERCDLELKMIADDPVAFFDMSGPIGLARSEKELSLSEQYEAALDHRDATQDYFWSPDEGHEEKPN